MRKQKKHSLFGSFLKLLILVILAVALAIRFVPQLKGYRTLLETYTSPVGSAIESQLESEKMPLLVRKLPDGIHRLASGIDSLIAHFTKDTSAETVLSDSSESKTEKEETDRNGSLQLTDGTSVTYYNYSQLDDEEQQYYQIILEGLEAEETEIQVDLTDQDQLWNLYTAVLDDHPELFWVEYGYSGSLFLMYASIEPSYNCTGAEKEKREAEVEAAEQQALAAIGTGQSDYEKAKGVFEYVIDHVDYVEGSEENQNIYSALVKGQSVCAGYSRTVQYLLQRLGLEALYVSGDVTGQGSHAWNIVKCNGKYYQLDATFGDRAFTGEVDDSMPEELHYDYTYLCCDDSVMYRDRTLSEGTYVPACVSTDLNYYQLQGVYFDSFDDTVKTSVRDSIQSDLHYWRCQFSNDAAYQEMLSAINDNWYAKQLWDLDRVSSGTITTWNVHDDENRIICLWY